MNRPLKRTKSLAMMITPELHNRLVAASEQSLYSLSMSQIVERGINLAIKELENETKEKGHDS